MKIVAHRGASAAEPENTPEAFRAADRLGADGVELDVRLAPTRDGGWRLAVHHDPLPDDQATIDGFPDLDDVLEACGARLLVNVEIKNSADDGGFDPTMAVVAPTIDAMRRHDARVGASDASRWLVSSFSPETVAHVRSVAPDLATALLCYPLDAATIGLAVDAGHLAVHPWEHLVDRDGVVAAHEAGLRVNVWTVNDPARIVELEALGVDGVCTDVPDVAAQALGRSGPPASAPLWRDRPRGRPVG